MKHELEGRFYLKEAAGTEWLETSIPGSVLSTLLAHGKCPDPYYRDQEYEVRELFRKDYEWKGIFEVSEEDLSKEEVELVFYGIDTLCDLTLNGSFLGKTNNMHRSWRFPCKELLKPGENELFIYFHSPITYVENVVPREGREIKMVNTGTMYGSQYLRKAHSMYGWDWGAQLPDSGIFRSVELCAYSGARLGEVEVLQEHRDGEAELAICVDVEGKQKEFTEVKLTLTAPGGEKSECTLPVENGTAKGSIHVKKPSLWWPNGYGEQPLYELKVQLTEKGNPLDEKRMNLGLRTLTISQEKDEWGSEFCFVVNGVKIFAMGADYIPEDCVYPWITRERQERLLDDAVRANFNCIRVWGGGYYPSDEFYDMCDRKGLIVWQDLMYACNIYDLTEEFIDNIEKETRDNVLRLRHHASLGLWCGNNEMETAWINWEETKHHPNSLRRDYLLQFEYILPKIVRECDKQTFYWPSSPSSTGSFDHPDDENRGDCHYWEVWHGQKPFSDYRKYYFRFCSEFGFQSLPSMKTVESFTEEADRNLFSKVMESHQKNPSANGKILYYLSENFRYPKDLPGIVYISQVMQGMAMKTGVEHWRRNRGRCMGSLYWQYNDDWPVASWASVDYYGRWKALHYMAKNFYRSHAGSLVRTGDSAEAWFANETREKARVKAILTLKTLDFEVLDKVEAEMEAEPLSSIKLIGKDYRELIQGREEEVFLEGVFLVNGEEALAKEVEIFVPYKYLKLKDAQITWEMEEKEEGYEITLQGKSFAPFVQLDFRHWDGIFSDNFFHLTSGEAVKITAAREDLKKHKGDPEEAKEELYILSMKDTY